MKQLPLDIPHEELADFCSRRHIRRLAVFGSVLREDFRSDSDIDVLVEFDTGHVPGLIGFEGIAIELATLMGDHHVYLNTPGSLSPYFRDRVLDDAEDLYVREG